MVTKKDYLLVAVIGLFFGLFAAPILTNVVDASFFSISVGSLAALMIVCAAGAVIALWVAHIVARFIPIVLQIAKFAAVGGFNTFLDWGVVNLLMAVTGTAAGLGLSIFKGISFIIANSGSYFWNKYWTFGSRDTASAGEVGKFFAVSIVGFLLNVGILSFVVNVISMPEGFTDKQWANVGFLLATAVSLVWNFMGYKLLVFKKKRIS